MVSICIIVKNEEKSLKACLEKITCIGYEVIVVDTGSTDGTKVVASEYTEKVYDFEWCDDFSTARNYAIDKASKDYIMMVDSDEFLIDMDKASFEELILQHPQDVGRVHRNNIFARNGVGFSSNELVNRVFPKRHYRYQGKIHEQIVSFSGGEYSTYSLPVYFEHGGYDGDLEVRRKKTSRNIRMLEQSLLEKGDDPYIIYQLGKAFYLQEDYEKAAGYFSKALEYDLDISLEYVIDMVEMYGYSLINANRFADALMFENIYEEFSHSADFVFLMGLIYMQNSLFDKAEEEFVKASGYQECKVEGVNSYLANYNAGVIRECLGDREKAISYYKKCGNYELAKEAVRRCQ